MFFSFRLPASLKTKEYSRREMPSALP